MRILIFHGYLLRGTGSNIYNANLARSLAGLGHEVHLFCQDRSAQEPEGVTIHVPISGGCRSRKFHPAGIRAVKQNQGIISPDVRDALPAWDVLRQPVQAATPA